MSSVTILKAMADKNRMKILRLLAEQNCCVRSLAKKLGLTEAAASQHLKILKEAGLLVGEKRGYFMHYSIKSETLYKLSDEIKALADLSSDSVTKNIFSKDK